MKGTWVYVAEYDVWELSGGIGRGAIQGTTVREWPAGKMSAWLAGRGLPELPSLEQLLLQ